MILNADEVRSYLELAGFTGQALDYAVEISSCESGFNTDAHLLTSREDSRGLMQINIKAHPEYSHLNLYDPAINTEVAFDLYSLRGNTFRDWTCAINNDLEFPAMPIQTIAENNNQWMLFAIIGIAIYVTRT